MNVLSTARLSLRHLELDDAAFMLQLLNDPAWITHIGDRGVRTEEAAREYLRERLIGHYERHGFGLWMVEPREGGAPMGICGLVRRDTLPGPDLGFAFMPEYRGKGIACEASLAVRDHAAGELGIARLLAITTAANVPSSRLLERLGFVAQGEMPPAAGDGQPMKVYAYEP